GRTARAGKSGMAISLACEKYVQGLEGIENYIGMKIPVEWHDEDMLVEDQSFGMRIDRDHDRGSRGERGGRGERKDHRGGGRGDKRRDDRGGRSEQPRGEFKRPRLSREGDFSQREHPSSTRPESHRTEHRPAQQHPAKSHTQRPQQGQHQHKGPRYEKKPFEAKKGTHRPEQHSKPKGIHHEGRKVNPRRDGNIEERVAYYRQKYGEDFTITDEMLRDDRSKKPSLMQKIKGIFRKK
ncbi:MAG TPA: hypothetical protein VF857_07135, partial [Spirochaetota bacterium]